MHNVILLTNKLSRMMLNPVLRIYMYLICH
jgi:hypothetical protein